MTGVVFVQVARRLGIPEHKLNFTISGDRILSRKSGHADASPAEPESVAVVVKTSSPAALKPRATAPKPAICLPPARTKVQKIKVSPRDVPVDSPIDSGASDVDTDVVAAEWAALTSLASASCLPSPAFTLATFALKRFLPTDILSPALPSAPKKSRRAAIDADVTVDAEAVDPFTHFQRIAAMSASAHRPAILRR